MRCDITFSVVGDGWICPITIDLPYFHLREYEQAMLKLNKKFKCAL